MLEGFHCHQHPPSHGLPGAPGVLRAPLANPSAHPVTGKSQDLLCRMDTGLRGEITALSVSQAGIL